MTRRERDQQIDAAVRAHHSGLRYFIRSLGVNEAWVDDLAQETFVIAHRKWEELDNPDNAPGWFRSIARNLVMSVLPITGAGMDYDVSDKRIPSGVPALDEMLGGGYYEGSCILLTGTSGTGKSTLGAHLAEKSCAEGKRCLYFSFEESPKQIVRNMPLIVAKRPVRFPV